MTHTHKPLQSYALVIPFFLMLCTGIFSPAKAYTVSDLTAEYHNGQVFLTWNNPAATNLQYTLYRSTSKFTSSSQLTSSKCMGFVRDNSSKNIFWSQQSNFDVYYKITNGGQPLDAGKGLYVVTCNANQSFYYAVTVTNLSNSSEDKTIVMGENSLKNAFAETVAKPQPVFQDSVETESGEIKQVYVQYVNNQETTLYPAMNSTGSYGFNFFVVKRGNATSYPLFLLYEGFGGKDADKPVNLDDDFTNCYAMGLFDWLPLPNDEGGIGDNCYYLGYHEKFNIYINTNPIPTTGIIHTYPQKRYMEAIKWLQTQVAVDTNKIYAKGSSACGYGALVTAALYPEKIAVVYGSVEPNSVNCSTDIYKQMWGDISTKLKTDITDWVTGDTLTYNDLKDLQKMVNRNELRNLPLIYDIHGKNDVSVVWSDGKIKWMDSLESNHVGGAWYWDQRGHGGGGNFIAAETQPNFYRFAKNISYPAFSNCSINQDPGNGIPTNGDDYGAINGYLEWTDNNIIDRSCSYTIHVFIKDFYVGGILDLIQYLTCTTDITFRGLQNFDPPIGSTIQWKNFDELTGLKLQSGKIIYTGGLITIPDLIVNKIGNKIKLKVENCSSRLSEEDEDFRSDDPENSSVYFSKSSNGYTAHIDVMQDEPAQVYLFDLTGRMILEKNMNLVSGSNMVDIPFPSNGIYFVQVKGETFSYSEKLFF